MYICILLNNMNKFSIAQLAQFSGIKAHTIRMWEQRYQALNPERTEGNIRLYGNSDLKRLLNIVSLLQRSYKISEISSLTDVELAKNMLKQQANQVGDADMEEHILQMISSGLSFNEQHFEKIFSHCILRYGLKKTYGKVIFPLLERLGIMWAGETLPPAQEHFISNILRKKIFTAIDSLPPPSSPKTWLLFLPEEEFHELSLLFAHYVIQQSGQKVIYLGSNVPFDSVIASIQSIEPENLLLFFVHQDFPSNIKKYILDLSDNFKGNKIHLGGKPSLIENCMYLSKVHCLFSPKDLEQVLEKYV